MYDGANPYMDFNGSGALTERYLTNPNALSQFYGQVNASGTAQWFLTDNINSIRQVVSTTGTSLDAITYDPYGNIVSQTNAANAPRFLYAGGEYDSLTGEYRYGRRVDKPADGQWLSPDPSGLAADRNPYRYVRNDPTNMVDPTGLIDSSPSDRMNQQIAELNSLMEEERNLRKQFPSGLTPFLTVIVSYKTLVDSVKTDQNTLQQSKARLIRDQSNIGLETNNEIRVLKQQSISLQKKLIVLETQLNSLHQQQLGIVDTVERNMKNNNMTKIEYNSEEINFMRAHKRSVNVLNEIIQTKLAIDKIDVAIAHKRE